MGRHRQHHISGWPAVLLAPLVIPLIVVVLLLQKLSILRSTADLTSADVAGYIQEFLEGRSGEWDWDDFTSIPITDPSLDRIREEASSIDLPLTVDGEVVLRGLLEEVRAFQPTSKIGR